MSIDRLRQHYDEKYSAEGLELIEAPTPLPIRQRYPYGRIAAALTYLPDRVVGKDILEIGAGAGVIAESLRVGDVAFSSYTLGDLSAQRLRGLQSSLKDDRYRFLEVDGDHPLAAVGDSKFDVVVSLDVIEHLLDPIGAMAETRQVLKPGGFVYINTPNVARWTHRGELFLGRFPATASTNEGLTTYDGKAVDLRDEGHFHYFTFRALTKLLTERCGFARVEPAPYSAGPNVLGSAASHMLAKVRPQLFSGLAVMAYA